MILVLCTLSVAFMVRPTYIAMHDTGDDLLDTMEVNLTIDCDTRELIVEPSTHDGERLVGSKTYLFYTDYGYQLISTGTSDQNGISRMTVIGNIDYLRALFILRVDHNGYQSRETEFTYQKCFEAPPQQTEEEEPETQDTEPEAQNQTTPVTPQINDTLPHSQNVTEPETDGEIEHKICPIGILIMGIPLLVVRCARHANRKKR